MKHLATIWLIFLLTNPTTWYFDPAVFEITICQEVEDKGEQSGEEQQTEYLPCVHAEQPVTGAAPLFYPANCSLRPSPTFDRLAPPPDTA